MSQLIFDKKYVKFQRNSFCDVKHVRDISNFEGLLADSLHCGQIIWIFSSDSHFLWKEDVSGLPFLRSIWHNVRFREAYCFLLILALPSLSDHFHPIFPGERAIAECQGMQLAEWVLPVPAPLCPFQRKMRLHLQSNLSPLPLFQYSIFWHRCQSARDAREAMWYTHSRRFPCLSLVCLSQHDLHWVGHILWQSLFCKFYNLNP